MAKHECGSDDEEIMRHQNRFKEKKNEDVPLIGKRMK